MITIHQVASFKMANKMSWNFTTLQLFRLGTKRFYINFIKLYFFLLRFQEQRFTGVRMILSKCQDMIERTPKLKLICFSSISCIVVAMFLLVYLHLDSWDLSSYHGISPTENTRPVIRMLGLNIRFAPSRANGRYFVTTSPVGWVQT